MLNLRCGTATVSDCLIMITPLTALFSSRNELFPQNLPRNDHPHYILRPFSPDNIRSYPPQTRQGAYRMPSSFLYARPRIPGFFPLRRCRLPLQTSFPDPAYESFRAPDNQFFISFFHDSEYDLWLKFKYNE